MLSNVLPTVPFANPPKKEWKNSLEKKSRLTEEQIKRMAGYGGGEEQSDSDASSYSSYSSYSSDSEEVSAISSPKFSTSTKEISTRKKKPGGYKLPTLTRRKASAKSVDSTSTTDTFQDNVNYLLENPLLLTTGSKYLVELPPPPKRLVPTIYDILGEDFVLNPWTRFVNWRRAERGRRLHYMTRHFMKQVEEYEHQQRLKVQQEIEADEKAVLIAAYHSAEQMKKNLFKRRNKLAVTEKFEQDLRRRNEETARMNFNVDNLPRWFVERHDEKRREAIEEERLAMERHEVWVEDQRRQRVEQIKAEDAAILEEDVEFSQEVLEIMRKSGTIAGVNAGAKRKPKPKKNVSSRIEALNEEFVELTLREDVDFSRVTKVIDTGVGKKKKKKKHRSSVVAMGDGYYPFDIDLGSKADNVRFLKASTIGERGALALAGEFVRHSFPVLESLDLSYCQVQTRGLGRLLRGIKLAKLTHLYALNLRANLLTPKCVEFLKDLFESDIFNELRVLDLRNNEIGDEGINAFVLLIFRERLKYLNELLLQDNGITDRGFSKLVKVLQSLQESKCPELRRVNLERNPITNECKLRLAPLPSCISL